MTRIGAQDFTKQDFRFFPVVGYEGAASGFLYTLPLRIGEARALEGRTGIRVLAQVNEHVAVGEPCEMVVGRALQNRRTSSRACSGLPSQR